MACDEIYVHGSPTLRKKSIHSCAIASPCQLPLSLFCVEAPDFLELPINQAPVMGLERLAYRRFFVPLASGSPSPDYSARKLTTEAQRTQSRESLVGRKRASPRPSQHTVNRIGDHFLSQLFSLLGVLCDLCVSSESPIGELLNLSGKCSVAGPEVGRGVMIQSLED